jgi:hypothetical protein
MVGHVTVSGMNLWGFPALYDFFRIGGYHSDHGKGIQRVNPTTILHPPDQRTYKLMMKRHVTKLKSPID